MLLSFQRPVLFLQSKPMACSFYSIMYPAGMQSQICRLISFFSCLMIFFSSLEI